MLSITKTIFQFSKHSLKVSKVNLHNAGQISTIFESEYNKDNLTTLFTEFKKAYIHRGRILLSEDLAYVVSFILPELQVDVRSFVETKLSGIVPENLDNSAWDFKVVNVKDGRHFIQAYVIKKEFFDTLIKALNNTGITIEAIEPVSLSLARVLKDIKTVNLILYKDEFTTMGCITKGDFVYTSSHINEPILTKDIVSLFNYSQNQFDIKPEKIFLSGSFEGIDKGVFQNKGYEVKEVTLNPLIGLSHKSDIQGSDVKTLNIDQKTIQEMENKEDYSNNYGSYISNNGSNKKQYIIITFVILLLIIIIVPFSFINNRTRSKPTPVESTPTVMVTPTPEEVEINIKDYSIQVQNGTGIAGVAGKVETIFTGEGFIVLNTTNADEFNFVVTKVNTKDNVPSEVTDIIVSLLAEDGYEASVFANLTDESNYDVIIIVGEKE